VVVAVVVGEVGPGLVPARRACAVVGEGGLHGGVEGGTEPHPRLLPRISAAYRPHGCFRTPLDLLDPLVRRGSSFLSASPDPPILGLHGGP
jgi:hypothetical protein